MLLIIAYYVIILYNKYFYNVLTYINFMYDKGVEIISINNNIIV